MEAEYMKLLEMKGITLEDVFEYLELLRESGVTNMFGARPYIEEQFEVGKSVAGFLLKKWMDSYRP